MGVPKTLVFDTPEVTSIQRGSRRVFLLVACCYQEAQIGATGPAVDGLASTTPAGKTDRSRGSC